MDRGSASAVVHLPGAVRHIDMGAFGMTVKADAALTGGGFSLLEASEPAGFGPPMHVHEDAGEAFYVLEGEYHVVIEDVEHACPAGTFVYVPAGMVHGFRAGAVQSRKLNIYSPAAMVGYFDELASAAAAGTVLGDDELGAMALRYGMHVLGPVPDGYA